MSAELNPTQTLTRPNTAVSTTTETLNSNHSSPSTTSIPSIPTFNLPTTNQQQQQQQQQYHYHLPLTRTTPPIPSSSHHHPKRSKKNNNKNTTITKRGTILGQLSEQIADQNDPSIQPYGCGYPECTHVQFNNSGLLLAHWRDCHENFRRDIERPFLCKMDGCLRHWKNIAGIRYHIQTAPDHFITDPTTNKRVRNLNPEPHHPSHHHSRRQNNHPDTNNNNNPFPTHHALNPSESTQKPRNPTRGRTKKKVDPNHPRSAKSEERDAARKYLCPVEGCDKRYQQTSGLKYHLSNGTEHAQEIQRDKAHIDELIAKSTMQMLQARETAEEIPSTTQHPSRSSGPSNPSMAFEPQPPPNDKNHSSLPATSHSFIPPRTSSPQTSSQPFSNQSTQLQQSSPKQQPPLKPQQQQQQQQQPYRHHPSIGTSTAASLAALRPILDPAHHHHHHHHHHLLQHHHRQQCPSPQQKLPTPSSPLATLVHTTSSAPNGNSFSLGSPYHSHSSVQQPQATEPAASPSSIAPARHHSLVHHHHHNLPSPPAISALHQHHHPSQQQQQHYPGSPHHPFFSFQQQQQPQHPHHHHQQQQQLSNRTSAPSPSHTQTHSSLAQNINHNLNQVLSLGHQLPMSFNQLTPSVGSGSQGGSLGGPGGLHGSSTSPNGALSRSLDQADGHHSLSADLAHHLPDSSSKSDPRSRPTSALLPLRSLSSADKSLALLPALPSPHLSPPPSSSFSH